MAQKIPGLPNTFPVMALVKVGEAETPLTAFELIDRVLAEQGGTGEFQSVTFSYQGLKFTVTVEVEDQ